MRTKRHYSNQTTFNTRGNKSESTRERRKTKNIPRQDRTIQTKRDILKQRKKILPASRGKMHGDIPITDEKGVKQFWAKIWKRREHHRKVEWFNNMKRVTRTWLTQSNIQKVPNWKTPGHDGIHGYWFKKFTSIHDKLAVEMSRFLQETNIPEWMTKGKTNLAEKTSRKELLKKNYRSITSLLMIWKILTAQIREIYDLLISCWLFLEEQKGYHMRTRGIGDLLYID